MSEREADWLYMTDSFVFKTLCSLNPLYFFIETNQLRCQQSFFFLIVILLQVLSLVYLPGTPLLYFILM